MSVFAGLTNVGLLGLIAMYQLMFLQYGVAGSLRGKKLGHCFFLTFQQSICHTSEQLSVNLQQLGCAAALLKKTRITNHTTFTSMQTNV